MISEFMAKLLGPYCIVVAVGILSNMGYYKKMMEEFGENVSLVYLGGVCAFLFGMLVLLFHNLWVADWRVIITIFGWGGVIKGAWLFILPKTVGKVVGAYKNPVLLTIHISLVLLIGVVLTYQGYFA